MRHPRAVVFITILAAVALACGKAEEPVTAENVEETITRKVEEQTGLKPSADTTPCEILSDELLRAFFDIGTGVEIARSPSKYSPYPLCTASWPKSNAEEIEKKRATAMSEYLQRKMRGEEVKMPSLRTTDEVSLTLYQPAFESTEKAISSFDVAMKRLSEGMTRSHENVQVTFQADVTPVDGVGNKAMWAPTMRQLSVVDRNRIFHVVVHTGAELEAELEKAKALAQRIASEL
ncbi:MAG TPA: hypothetical protein VMT00_04685 [Thermoanaerobaculia bacterium]|nr:hypothetical protein [Thermoanaerobaculia bacterium]